MIKNYIKIAFRSLARDRAFSLLNLTGLAVGLASVIMIMAYVRYELSYDKTYSNYPQVYRLLMHDKPGSANEIRVNVNDGMGNMLRHEFPAVVANSRVGWSNVEFKNHGDFAKIKAIYADAEFFKIFNFPFISGDAKTALAQPNNIVLTASAATRYFKGKNPIGEVITDGHGNLLHVTGIIKDIPLNNHLSGDAVVANDRAPGILNMQDFTSEPEYVLLDKQANTAQLSAQFKSIYKKYGFPEGTGLSLQPVIDIHLRSHYFSEISTNSDIKYIYIFSSIALLILIIAGINYVNLTTARSLQRAKEIGLRKVLGAQRTQLVFQFLTESFLFFLISTILAAVIASLAWPVFAARVNLFQQNIALFDAKSIAGMLMVLVVGGLLSGAYPAFFLSSFQPVRVLKGLSKFGVNITLRKALVVFQFAVSGVLIICTLIVSQQLRYINNARLGFNKDNLITIPYHLNDGHPAIFEQELMRDRHVLSATSADWRIGESLGSYNNYKTPGDTTKEIRVDYLDAGLNFTKTMGVHIIEGRGFSAAYPKDVIGTDSAWKAARKMKGDAKGKYLSSFPIIVNQAAVKLLGLKNPVGAVITKYTKGTIVGVAEDFNGLTLRDKIGPVFISCSPDPHNGGQLYVRISSANTRQILGHIENTWKIFYPTKRFEFTFVDDKLQSLYTDDKRLCSLFGIFSTLAVIIGCMGLFGLVMLSVQNRVKEIGIRKVLGATALNIARLISADFLKPVLLSFIISSPIAWYFMNKWLQDFAYRIDIEWWVFALACGIALLVAFVTLGLQSIKAAMASPVKSLRNE